MMLPERRLAEPCPGADMPLDEALDIIGRLGASRGSERNRCDLVDPENEDLDEDDPLISCDENLTLADEEPEIVAHFGPAAAAAENFSFRSVLVVWRGVAWSGGVAWHCGGLVVWRCGGVAV